MVLIDIDHMFEYLLDTRDITFRGFFTFYDILLNNLDKGYLGLSLFHTVEVYVVLALLGSWWPAFHVVLAGFLFHHLFDVWFLWRLGVPTAKAFSILDYYTRRRGRITRIRQVLASEGVKLENVRNIEIWGPKWGK